MGWNGSESKNAGHEGLKFVSGRERSQVAPSRIRGIVAGIAVVVLGIGISAYFLFGDLGKSSRQDAHDGIHDRPSRIADVGTNAVRATVSAQVSKARAYKDMTREEKLKFWRDKYGNNLPENIKPIVYYLENPPQKTYRGKSRPESIFHRRSERQIAAFLSVTPGNLMVRPKVFDKSFDDDFAQSMAEKIEILPDDTEEQRKLKELVISAKKELAQRLKAGETPSEIMTATARELYDLGLYRRNLQKEVIAAQHDPNKSDQDVADTIEAANKMLAAKGLKGLKSIHPAIRQANLERRSKFAAKKEATKQPTQGTNR